MVMPGGDERTNLIICHTVCYKKYVSRGWVSGLKIRWQQCRAGSSPAPGTRRETPHIVGFFAIYLNFIVWHIMEYYGI